VGAVQHGQLLQDRRGLVWIADGLRLVRRIDPEIPAKRNLIQSEVRPKHVLLAWQCRQDCSANLYKRFIYTAWPLLPASRRACYTKRQEILLSF